MFYITRFGCKKKYKKYIIPTKDWLEPLKELELADISTRGKLFLSELLSQERILVKVTLGRNHDLKRINNSLKMLPNTVYTYCTFFCNDDINEILDNKSFCNSNGKKVTLELMYYYKRGSLTKFNNSKDIKEVKNILKQIILCQLNIFKKLKLTHNDIHLGNILIQKYKTAKTLNYQYINEIIINKFEYILNDYDMMISFNINDIKKFKDTFKIDDYLSFSLTSNIIITLNVIKKLLKNKYNKFEIIQEKYEEELLRNAKNNIKNYFKNKISENDYVNNELLSLRDFIKEILE